HPLRLPNVRSPRKSLGDRGIGQCDDGGVDSVVTTIKPALSGAADETQAFFDAGRSPRLGGERTAIHGNLSVTALQAEMLLYPMAEFIRHPSDRLETASIELRVFRRPAQSSLHFFHEAVVVTPITARINIPKTRAFEGVVQRNARFITGLRPHSKRRIRLGTITTSADRSQVFSIVCAAQSSLRHNVVHLGCYIIDRITAI